MIEPSLAAALMAEYGIQEDDQVRSWLALEVAMNRQNQRRAPLHYEGPQDFVLREGLDWPSPARLDPEYPTGTPRNCYGDAFMLALDSELTYVEGYAWCGRLVVPHAWTVKPSGEVVDVTWADDRSFPRSEWEYVGVPFGSRFVVRQTMKQSVYGLIHCWEKGFPLLREPLDRRRVAEAWR